MENTSYSIKHWAEDDRPREKLLNKGKFVLSDSELIAILIGSGNREKSAVELSKEILADSNNNLIELTKLSVKELTKFKGIGEAKAISIIAALELGKRRRAQETLEKPKIQSSKAAFEIVYPHLSDLAHEEFWVLLMSNSNKLLTKKRISVGGINGTVADGKIIFKEAIEQSAIGIILCHNHPSGNLEASEADISLTNKLFKAGKLLDINVLDHIIVAGETYLSFADEGMMGN